MCRGTDWAAGGVGPPPTSMALSIACDLARLGFGVGAGGKGSYVSGELRFGGPPGGGAGTASAPDFAGAPFGFGGGLAGGLIVGRHCDDGMLGGIFGTSGGCLT